MLSGSRSSESGLGPGLGAGSGTTGLEAISAADSFTISLPISTYISLLTPWCDADQCQVTYILCLSYEEQEERDARRLSSSAHSIPPDHQMLFIVRWAGPAC